MPENVEWKVVKGKLQIVVDLNHEVGLSGSGKNITIAKTGGNIEVGSDNGAMFGLNVYKPKPKE